MINQEGRTMVVHKEARDVPVRAEVDVLVAGGGLGGICAAIASARAGARTLLVERNSFLGGVATAGMCCSMFNFLQTSDGEIGTGGIALEIADALAEGTGYGPRWRNHKGHIIYDVEHAKLALETMVNEAGADILYESVISDAIVESGDLKGLILETRSGREAIMAKMVVDATGDSEVARRAGAAVHTSKRDNVHTLIFRLGNVDVDRLVQYFVDNPGQYPEYMDVDWSFEEALAQYRDLGTFLFPHGGPMQMEIFQNAIKQGEYPLKVGLHDTIDACQMHAIRDKGVVHIITGFVHFRELDAEVITRSIIDGRKMSWLVTDFFRQNMPGFENADVIATADDLGIRISHWLDGPYTLTSDSYDKETRFDDAIAQVVWYESVVKHQGARAWSAQIVSPTTTDIPLRCLIPASPGGLIMGAGRSISIDNPSRFRTMVHTMTIGQGAGVSAAVAVRAGTPVADAPIDEIHAELAKQDVRI
jgi:hypothetical protein